MRRIFLIWLLLSAVAITPILASGNPPLLPSAPPHSSLPPSGRDIIKKMHDRYAGKWYRSFTFTQTTQRYRNDTMLPAQTWHEFIRNPDRFRMDFGPADSGNAVIYRGDSAYRFHSGQLRSISINNNEGLIFLLGGMFFYPLDQTIHIITDSLHYDLSRTRSDTWLGHPVYVIGADGANQLFIDQQSLLLLRMIKVDAQTMDARFEDWKPYGGGYSETKCEFYIDGKLIQVETYTDCKADVDLKDKIFDPSKLNRSW